MEGRGFRKDLILPPHASIHQNSSRIGDPPAPMSRSNRTIEAANKENLYGEQGVKSHGAIFKITFTDFL